MSSTQRTGESDRAWFSSPLAVIAALAIAAFTYGTTPETSLTWPLKLVIAWSYALSVALLVWAVRDWLGIHWIGNPTLSMVAGASGTAIAAVALAFTLASAQEQDVKLKNQVELLREQNAVLKEQLQTMQRIEDYLKNSQGGVPLRPRNNTSTNGQAPSGASQE